MSGIWGDIWGDIWGPIWASSAAPQPTEQPVQIVVSGGGGGYGASHPPLWKHWQAPVDEEAAFIEQQNNAIIFAVAQMYASGVLQ